MSRIDTMTDADLDEVVQVIGRMSTENHRLRKQRSQLWRELMRLDRNTTQFFSAHNQALPAPEAAELFCDGHTVRLGGVK